MSPLGWLSRRKSQDLSSHAIFIPHLGRFGNALKEIVLAIGVAERSGVGNVFFAGDNVFATHSDLPHPGIHETGHGVKVWIDTPVSRKHDRFETLITWSRMKVSISGKVADQAWESARKSLGLDSSETPFDSETLVVHLRGGDVFSERNVSNYGQPPLAFYLAVLRHRKWKSVVIVHQDLKNPVLEGLVAACEARNISYTTFSGALSEDLPVLLKAQNLVAGRGTFVPAVAGLSQHVKTVYFFEDKFVMFPPRSGLTIVRIVDTKGDYRASVLQGQWRNSPEQLEMMLNYPEKNLGIDRGPQ